MNVVLVYLLPLNKIQTVSAYRHHIPLLQGKVEKQIERQALYAFHGIIGSNGILNQLEVVTIHIGTLEMSRDSDTGLSWLLAQIGLRWGQSTRVGSELSLL